MMRIFEDTDRRKLGVIFLSAAARDTKLSDLAISIEHGAAVVVPASVAMKAVYMAIEGTLAGENMKRVHDNPDIPVVHPKSVSIMMPGNRIRKERFPVADEQEPAMIWCDQCDRRVTVQEVGFCRSNWCGARP